MKRTTNRTLKTITLLTLIALISVSCALFQAGQKTVSETNTPTESAQEKPAATMEMLPTIPPEDNGPPVSDYELPSPSDLVPGTFSYKVTGAGEDANIDGGTLQDQSTTEEYVIGFSSQNSRYAVTLFLPLDLSEGELLLKPYDDNSFAKSPSAAIYIGTGYFYADNGVVTIDSLDNSSMTGSFAFHGVFESDPSRTVTVVGVFNGISLAKK